MRWYKDSNILNVASNNRFYVSDLSGTLFIRQVQESDVGMYHCEVSNNAGSMSSSQAQLSLVNSVPSKCVCVCVCVCVCMCEYVRVCVHE